MLGLIVALAVPLQYIETRTVQPRTLVSPSGEWTARTDPSSKFGDGPSHVAVKHGDDAAWAADEAFTFWDARISDGGCLAGYGFTEGRAAPKGEFVVAIFGPDGRELVHEAQPLTWSPHPDFPPNPYPLGLFIQPTLDRFVVRVSDENLNRNDEAWWTYRLSTGEALGRVHPKGLLGAAGGVGFTIDARPVAGTPLTLVQWNCSSAGTRFVLVGEDWKPVWNLDLARDYFSFGPDEAERLSDEARKSGGILAAGEPRRFELRHVSAKERVTYEVTADEHEAGGWAVKEVARSAYVEPSATAALARLELREIATVPLQVGARREAGAIHDLEAFDVLSDGGVRLVRRDAGGGVALLSLDAEGAVVHAAHLDALVPEAQDRRAWHPLGEDRWLFTVSPFGDGALSRAWLVDGDGVATEVHHFVGPSIVAVRPAPDGGFVVIGTYDHRYSMSEALIAFDRAGARRWEHVTDSYSGDPSELMGVDDLAVGADGTVLVLDSVRQAVLLFGADGRYDRTVKLDLSTEGRDKPYLTGLRTEPSGSWLVREFRAGGSPWHRVDREGGRLGGFELRREDGSTDPGLDGNLRVDARGGLWTTDGQALYLLDETGVLHPRFGLSPDATTLEEPIHVAFDRRGRIAVVDRRSHAVHLFAASGARELVLQPAPEDFEELSTFPDVIAAPDGRLFVEADFFKGALERPPRSRKRYLQFAADGQRVGWVDLGGDQVAFCVDGGSWAAEGFQHTPGVNRLDAAGATQLTLARRPDESFYLAVDALDCEPDGSLWVLTGSRQGELELDRWSAAGEATRTIALHGAPGRGWHGVSAAGQWVLVSSYADGVILAPADGQPSLADVRPGAEHKSCAYTLSPDGTELWAATVEPLALHRYALPESR